MSDRAPQLSLVVPAFNEAESLAELVGEIRSALDPALADWELLLVDDGSTDRTLEVARRLAAGEPRIRVLRHLRRAGQSAALALGFRSARGARVVTLDADLQNDPADLPRLLALLDRADVVNGVRAERRDTLVRKLSSKIGNGFRNWMTGESVTDVGCSLRVMRAEPLRRVKMFRGMHRFLPTLLRMEGARVIEVPVAHRPRHAGSSKYGIANRLFTGLHDVLAVRWMQRRALHYRVKE